MLFSFLLFAINFIFPDRMEKQYSIKYSDNKPSRNILFGFYLYFIVKQTREKLDKEVN